MGSSVGFIIRRPALNSNAATLLKDTQPEVILVEMDNFGDRLSGLAGVTELVPDTTIVFSFDSLRVGDQEFDTSHYTTFVENFSSLEEAATEFVEGISAYKASLPPNSFVQLFPKVDMSDPDLNASFVEFVDCVVKKSDIPIAIGALDLTGEFNNDLHWIFKLEPKTRFIITLTLTTGVKDDSHWRSVLDLFSIKTNQDIQNTPIYMWLCAFDGWNSVYTELKHLHDPVEDFVGRIRKQILSWNFIKAVAVGYIGSRNADELSSDISRDTYVVNTIKSVLNQSVPDELSMLQVKPVNYFSPPQPYKVLRGVATYSKPFINNRYRETFIVGTGQIVLVDSLILSDGFLWGATNRPTGIVSYVPIASTDGAVEFMRQYIPPIGQPRVIPQPVVEFIAVKDQHPVDLATGVEIKDFVLKKGTVLRAGDMVISKRRVLRIYYEKDVDGKEMKLYLREREFDQKGKETVYLRRVGVVGDNTQVVTELNELRVAFEQLQHTIDELRKQLTVLQSSYNQLQIDYTRVTSEVKDVPSS